jgi:gliding motility-associated-like protein
VVDLIWSEGCRATARLEPRVIGEETAYFPDAFTPDSNGLNDRYHPKGQDLWMSRFEIYDRWGSRIYAASPGEVDQLMGWDGSIEGNPAPGGVYVCVAEYQSLITQKKMTYRGTFTLLK